MTLLCLFGLCALAACGHHSPGTAGMADASLVCDPSFAGPGGQSQATSAGGAMNVGIYEIPPQAASTTTSVLALEAQSTLLNATVIFNQIYVPEMDRFQGFPTANGDVLRLPDGQVLAEDFALHITGTLTLPASLQEGTYQFALLSDDGAIFQLDQGGGAGLQPVISNDGEHEPRLLCSASGVSLKHGVSMNFSVDYYNFCQCSGDHTALTLLWRKMPAGFTSADYVSDPAAQIACGQEGNDVFFDGSQTPPTPTALWTQMLSDGWEVVPSAAYQLPAGASNPC